MLAPEQYAPGLDCIRTAMSCSGRQLPTLFGVHPGDPTSDRSGLKSSCLDARSIYNSTACLVSTIAARCPLCNMRQLCGVSFAMDSSVAMELVECNQCERIGELGIAMLCPFPLSKHVLLACDWIGVGPLT